MTTNTKSSYVDIPALSAATFNPYTYANKLVTNVNTSTTEQIDLTTPLQRTLFDLQEIDTSIHNLTTKRALDIITYTSQQNEAAQRILARVEAERVKLIADYERLRTEVLDRYERAETLRRGATNGLQVARLGQGVGKIVTLARSFEQALADAGVSVSASSTNVASTNPASRAARDDPKPLLGACHDLLDFRKTMAGRDGSDLGKVNIVKGVRGRIFEDGEAKLLDWARKIIREFSISSFVTANTTVSTAAVTGLNTYRETEEAKIRIDVACQILYLLSPMPKAVSGKELKHVSQDDFEAEYLVKALQGYLHNAVSSSAASIARGLGQLPSLDRACSEVSGRCQNVIGFEIILEQIRVPSHPSLKQKKQPDMKINNDDEDDFDDIEEELTRLNLQDAEDGEQKETVLELLISSLDTNVLASYFWRSLASSLTSRVQEIMNRGGVSARTLKTNKDMVRDEIRGCVARGSKIPAGLVGSRGVGMREPVTENWEREAAVMVQSVIGPLNR